MGDNPNGALRQCSLMYRKKTPSRIGNTSLMHKSFLRIPSPKLDHYSSTKRTFSLKIGSIAPSSSFPMIIFFSKKDQQRHQTSFVFHITTKHHNHSQALPSSIYLSTTHTIHHLHLRVPLLPRRQIKPPFQPCLTPNHLIPTSTSSSYSPRRSTADHKPSTWRFSVQPNGKVKVPRFVQFSVIKTTNSKNMVEKARSRTRSRSLILRMVSSKIKRG